MQDALQHTAAHCITLQHTFQISLCTATQYNTLQHTTAHCNTLPRDLYSLRHTCNTLQHTATHCNTLPRALYPLDLHYINVTESYMICTQQRALMPLKEPHPIEIMCVYLHMSPRIVCMYTYLNIHLCGIHTYMYVYMYVYAHTYI